MKFGRLPRTYDARIPKLTSARGIALPVAVNYATGMPANLSMMLNDTLGCCVESAQGHSIQTWTFNSTVGKAMVTPSDAQIEAAYELEGGYVPGNPNTDNGTIIQVALKDWLSNAIDSNTLAAFVEVDTNNMQAIKESIFSCGFALIGFNVPSYLNENPGSIWDYDPNGNNSIIGGHCVICTGYQANGNLNLITWGSADYQMTSAFWQHFVDEAYALADIGWIQATGTTPGGLTLAQLEALMGSMKAPNVAPMRRHRHHRRMKRRNAVVK